MRHINYKNTGNHLVSLDGFNHGDTFSKLFIGDSSCTIRQSFRTSYADTANYAVPGLPVWDAELKRALEDTTNKVDKIFLFPATELHGVKRYSDLNMDLDWDERWIEFEDNERYCYNGREYKDTDIYDKTTMIDNYIDFISGLLNLYPNLYLVPTGNRWYSHRFPTYFSGYSLLKAFNRCLNLDWLNPNDLSFWLDKQGHISDKTFGLLREQIDAL